MYRSGDPCGDAAVRGVRLEGVASPCQPAAALALGGPGLVGVDRQLDEGQDAVPQLLGERDLCGGAADSLHLEHPPDDVLQVLVGVGHDPAVQVAGAGDRVDLEHLGDLAQVRADVLEPPLGDLEADERQHLVAHGAQVEVGVAPQMTPRCWLVEERVVPLATPSWRASSTSSAGGLPHRPDQPGVERIDTGGQHEQCVYHMCADSGQTAQSVTLVLTLMRLSLCWCCHFSNTATSEGEHGRHDDDRPPAGLEPGRTAPLGGIDHVEWWVGNARAFSAFLVAAFGFEVVA